ncbi:MAG: hypothetical protein CL424_08810 [Acidimicrobiaceae bacterium]|nr:hypothetical protein [Acidimicrobiaceae bacterium]
MGYELHVKRLRDGGVEKIEETEWFDFVSASPDFVLRDELSFSSPSGEQLTIRGPFGCWTGHPSVDLVPFRWLGGRVTVPFGDEHAVVGALLVADALDATVFGDEGEEYDDQLGSESISPPWGSADIDDPRSDPVTAQVPSFSAPPPEEEVAFDFDGGPTIWDRVLPWMRRQRRRSVAARVQGELATPNGPAQPDQERISTCVDDDSTHAPTGRTIPMTWSAAGHLGDRATERLRQRERSAHVPI